MRAIRIHETGGPEVLRLEEVELPKPGKGKVRLRQHAIGVNFVDVYFRNGFYPTPSLPFTPGGEAAGEVVEVGLGVEEFKPGDRVASASGSGASPRSATFRHRPCSSCRAAFPMRRRPP